jgi:signal transduction histidine kinase
MSKTKQKSEVRELNVAKDDFVFMVAHELRSPVTAMRYLVELFAEDHRVHHCDITHDYLSKMQEASNRMAKLVDDLLEVSRSETGRLKINVEPLSIAQSVYAILEESTCAATERNIEVRYIEDRDLPLVMADSHKLKEILDNLISNAIKYNKDNGSLVVGHQVDVERQQLVTWVADTGIGMDQEEMENIFTKFWRSDDPSVRAQIGTGLGMYIVKQLVERMNGEMEIETAKGQGTKVSFSLPIYQQ